MTFHIIRTQSQLGNDIARTLNRFGLSDLWLPFLLIFTIVFAALQKSKLLGSDRRKYNLVVALSISLMTVIPHITGTYPPGYDVVDIINTAIPQTIIIFVAIIMFLVLIGIFGIEAKEGSAISGVALLVSLVAIVYIFVRAAGGFEASNWFTRAIDNPDVQMLVVILLVFGVIVWFITSEPGGGPGAVSRVKDFFKELTT